MDIINSKIDELQSDLFKDIKRVVEIPSVEGKPSEGNPFGEEVTKALLKALEISEELGFKTKNLDNYIGYAEHGEGEEYVCVIGHLDVVPEGDGWKYPPYGGVIANEKMYGRGVLDNKGPTMCALYGLYALKELNIKLNKKVRIIFGTNEETGFNDIPYYLEREKKPLMGFTPDCKYPVVYAEKGIVRINVNVKDSNEVKEIKNILPKLSDKINVTGLNVVEDNGYIVEIKIKYDFDYTLEQVLEEINSNINKELNLDIVLHFNPVYFDKESKLVKSLQIAYERVTSLDGTPVPTNGGTYAKVMPNIVPFGPSFPGQKGIAHNPDEYMDLDDIILNAKIFANAIYEMAKEDLC